MKLFRTIQSAIPAFVAALHLCIASVGVPLVYMFCGESFCSWAIATTPQWSDAALANALDISDNTSVENKSCHASSCCAQENDTQTEQTEAGHDAWEQCSTLDNAETTSHYQSSECRAELHVVYLETQAIPSGRFSSSNATALLTLLPVVLHHFAYSLYSEPTALQSDIVSHKPLLYAGVNKSVLNCSFLI